MTAGAVSAPLPAVADEFDDGVKFTVGGADQFVVFGALAVGSFVLTIVIPGVFPHCKPIMCLLMKST